MRPSPASVKQYHADQEAKRPVLIAFTPEQLEVAARILSGPELASVSAQIHEALRGNV